MLSVTKHGSCIGWVDQLTKQCALKFGEELSHIHNLIPHVSWSAADIAADNIGARTFPHKWDLSQIVLSPTDKRTPIGLSIAYLRSASDDFLPFNSIYMHRGALAKSHQKKGLGIAMVGYALKVAFLFADKNKGALDPNSSYPVTMQTNDSMENRKRIELYRGLGGTVIGRKTYPDKADLILGFSQHQYKNSPLVPVVCEMLGQAVDRIEANPSKTSDGTSEIAE